MLRKRFQISLRQIGYILFGLTGLCLLALCTAWFAFPLNKDKYVRYDASQCVTDRNGNILRTTLNSDGQRCLPIRLEDAGEWFPQAIVATEDKRFYQHHGVDVLALARAFGQMIWHREVISGASTITTQTIRLVHPRPRTFSSKIIEAFRAMQMEMVLSKEEILEQYLNRSPFGGNIVGIRAASLHYFSKEPADLSLEEATLLAGLPQGPNRLHPERHPERAIERRKAVLAAMKKKGFVEEDIVAKANDAKVNLHLWAPPFLAPHFVDAILQERLSQSQAQDGDETPKEFYSTKTTLDISIQKMAEAQLAWHPSDKAHSAAIVILDAKSQKILALVGSPDFKDSTQAGQYNVALAKRSPGSTLKPFAYGLAMDRGLLTPEEILEDKPLELKGYNPDNYDLAFRGEVSARTALVESLNLPAIQVLQRVGLQLTLDTMHKMGLRTLDKPADHYGLNLILGGAEVRPLDLARAYCHFANPKPNSPITAEAVWMINEILSGNERNQAVFGKKTRGRAPKVAWKTGTSARNRDAWTVAWNHQYVVCVWRGNPDGSPCPEMTGLKDAAPLALEIFANLPYVESLPAKPLWPLMLKKRKVCAATGLPKAKQCTQTIMDHFIPGISHTALCQGQCRDKKTSTPKATKATRIVRPINGQTFALLPSQNNPTLPLEADSASEVFWFVNGIFFAKATPNKVLQLPLHPGTFDITCTTESGQADRARIFVE